ncbi:hypothetical protein MEO93_27190, partial [Dolichospermum sp. ST_sed3]|nr:hypothetical protein [Dolichospermum sp. ST_sed3]
VASSLLCHLQLNSFKVTETVLLFLSSSYNAVVANITPEMGGTSRAKHYAYRVGEFESVIVPLKVHYKSTPNLPTPRR